MFGMEWEGDRGRRDVGGTGRRYWDIEGATWGNIVGSSDERTGREYGNRCFKKIYILMY